jgi:hypothetical protein
MENTMASIQQNGSSTTSSSTKNNGGTGLNVGNTSTVLETRALGTSDVGVFASTPVDNAWADEAVSDGVFAYNNSRPVAPRLTTTLSGVTNNALLSGANVPGLLRSIHKIEALRTTKTSSGIRANKYNRFTGAWDAEYPQVSNDSLSEDTAANPTRSAPGQLTYKLGNPVPVSNNDYKAKTG